MPPKAKGQAKKKNGYQMPEKFSSGFVLKDIFKNNWTLGKPIGQGGFGLIYLANKGEGSKNLADAEYVVKIEPKDNGPLFCESHFYVNCAKEDQLKNFKGNKCINHLAIPRFISSGLCTYNEKEYRFLVMDRYAKDLQSFLNESTSHQINEIGIMCITRQILYALEYIHQKGYSHGDIKGANIMLKNDQEAYLVDYGLAYRFERDNIHQKYQEKPERRHNGTIEYTSLDAHNGAQISRRSDLEILAYCIVHWLSGTLPWIDQLKNPNLVQQSKSNCWENVGEFLKNTLNQKNISESVKKFVEFYLNEVKKLEFESEPPYSKIQAKINDTLKSLKHTGTDNFGLISPNKSKKKIINKSIEERSLKKNKLSLLNQSDSEDSDEDVRLKKNERKPKTPKTKNTYQNENMEIKNNQDINELSSINKLSDDEFKLIPKASKKSRAVFQSTAIDSNNFGEKLDSCVAIKSPKPKKSESKTPMNTPKVDKSSRLQKQPSFEEYVNENQYNGHHLKMDSPKISNKLTEVHNPTINKMKEIQPRMSPLALVNLNDKQNGFLLVKKRKNVLKCDAWTQTDQSYLSTLKKIF